MPHYNVHSDIRTVDIIDSALIQNFIIKSNQYHIKYVSFEITNQTIGPK
jgi:hypothetical protein